MNISMHMSIVQLYLLDIPGHSPNEFGLWGRGSTNLRRTSTFMDGLVPPKLLRRYELYYTISLKSDILSEIRKQTASCFDSKM